MYTFFIALSHQSIEQASRFTLDSTSTEKNQLKDEFNVNFKSFWKSETRKGKTQ